MKRLFISKNYLLGGVQDIFHDSTTAVLWTVGLAYTVLHYATSSQPVRIDYGLAQQQRWYPNLGGCIATQNLQGVTIQFGSFPTGKIGSGGFHLYNLVWREVRNEAAKLDPKIKAVQAWRAVYSLVLEVSWLVNPLARLLRSEVNKWFETIVLLAESENKHDFIKCKG